MSGSAQHYSADRKRMDNTSIGRPVYIREASGWPVYSC